MAEKVLIWSKVYKSFWKQDGFGYDRNLSRAGLFTQDEAKNVTKSSGGKDDSIISLEDAFFSLQQQVKWAESALLNTSTKAGEILDKIDTKEFLARN